MPLADGSPPNNSLSAILIWRYNREISLVATNLLERSQLKTYSWSTEITTLWRLYGFFIITHHHECVKLSDYRIGSIGSCSRTCIWTWNLDAHVTTCLQCFATLIVIARKTFNQVEITTLKCCPESIVYWLKNLASWSPTIKTFEIFSTNLSSFNHFMLLSPLNCFLNLPKLENFGGSCFRFNAHNALKMWMKWHGSSYSEAQSDVSVGI